MTDASQSNSHRWDEQLKTRFPDWLTDKAKLRWVDSKRSLSVGQAISGEVVARAPFGIWLDIGVSFPGLLLVPNMKDAKVRRIAFEDYPSIGTMVEGRINALGDSGEINITQQNPDKMIDGEITT